jgi:uncharacterized DUF497 family protein
MLAPPAKHGISFSEASIVFADLLSRTIPDPLYPHDEGRFIIVGESAAGRTFVVVHTHRGEAVRIISARKTTPHERRDYEQERE